DVCDLLDRLLDRGETWRRPLGGIDAVETDDRQILGHPQPVGECFLEDADRHQVARADHARRPRRMHQELSQCLATSLDAEVLVGYETVRIDARSPQRPLAAGGLLLRRQVEARPCRVADLAMPELEEVLCRALAFMHFVDA